MTYHIELDPTLKMTMVDGHIYLEERFKGLLMDIHYIVSIERLVLIYNTLVSKGYHAPLTVECKHGTSLRRLKQEWVECLTGKANKNI